MKVPFWKLITEIVSFIHMCVCMYIVLSVMKNDEYCKRGHHAMRLNSETPLITNTSILPGPPQHACIRQIGNIFLKRGVSMSILIVWCLFQHSPSPNRVTCFSKSTHRFRVSLCAMCTNIKVTTLKKELIIMPQYRALLSYSVCSLLIDTDMPRYSCCASRHSVCHNPTTRFCNTCTSRNRCTALSIFLTPNWAVFRVRI